MAKEATKIQKGEVVDYTATAAIANGDVVPLSDRVGVATNDAVIGDVISLELEGVWEIAAATADAVSFGDVLYFDATNRVVTKTSEIDTVTIVAAVDANVYAVNVNGITYSYTAGLGSTIATIADSLAAEIPNGVSDGVNTISVTFSSVEDSYVVVDTSTTAKTDIAVAETVKNIFSGVSVSAKAGATAGTVYVKLDK